MVAGQHRVYITDTGKSAAKEAVPKKYTQPEHLEADRRRRQANIPNSLLTSTTAADLTADQRITRWLPRALFAFTRTTGDSSTMNSPLRKLFGVA